MKLKHLESALEDVEVFSEPNIELEQYPTTPHLAARMLFTIHTAYDEIEDRHIGDFGCGCGALTIATALMGGRYGDHDEGGDENDGFGDGDGDGFRDGDGDGFGDGDGNGFGDGDGDRVAGVMMVMVMVMAVMMLMLITGNGSYSSVVGFDIDSSALDIAYENRESMELEDVIDFVHCDITQVCAAIIGKVDWK